jgi:hypothetical protein
MNSEASFVILLRDRNWNTVRERLHQSQYHDEIVCAVAESGGATCLITFESTPFDIYVEMTRICNRSDDILVSFNDEFILQHVCEFISILGPSICVQKILNRNSICLDAIAFDVMENSYPHLLYEWWTIKNCLHLSRGGNNRYEIAHKLFEIGIRRKIGSFQEKIEKDAIYPQTVIDSLACYKDLYYSRFCLLKKEDSKLFFVHFFEVLKKEFRDLLVFKDIVLGLKLIHSALDYGEDRIVQELTNFFQTNSSEFSQNIFHDLALLKQPQAISRAIEISVSSRVNQFQQDRNSALFQLDERNLSPLNYLWILEPPRSKGLGRLFANHWIRNVSLQRKTVETTIQCLHCLEKQNPAITRAFVYSWNGTVATLRKYPSQDLKIFTVEMMKRVVKIIAKVEGREPFHVACDYGILWNTGLRSMYHDYGHCVDDPDPKTNLKAFTLAASGNESDLSSVYRILRLSPNAILH